MKYAFVGGPNGDLPLLHARSSGAAHPISAPQYLAAPPDKPLQATVKRPSLFLYPLVLMNAASCSAVPCGTSLWFPSFPPSVFLFPSPFPDSAAPSRRYAVIASQLLQNSRSTYKQRPRPWAVRCRAMRRGGEGKGARRRMAAHGGAHTCNQLTTAAHARPAVIVRSVTGTEVR